MDSSLSHGDILSESLVNGSRRTIHSSSDSTSCSEYSVDISSHSDSVLLQKLVQYGQILALLSLSYYFQYFSGIYEPLRTGHAHGPYDHITSRLCQYSSWYWSYSSHSLDISDASWIVDSSYSTLGYRMHSTSRMRSSSSSWGTMYSSESSSIWIYGYIFLLWHLGYLRSLHIWWRSGGSRDLEGVNFLVV